MCLLKLHNMHSPNEKNDYLQKESHYTFLLLHCILPDTSSPLSVVIPLTCILPNESEQVLHLLLLPLFPFACGASSTGVLQRTEQFLSIGIYLPLCQRGKGTECVLYIADLWGEVTITMWAGLWGITSKTSLESPNFLSFRLL